MKQQILDYVRTQWNTEPETPWPESPDHIVWRHESNQKWYAIIMPVRSDRLGLSGEVRYIDVMNVKLDPVLIDLLRNDPGYLPAYHMNKKSWLSLRLDGSLSMEEILPLLQMSYDLTGGDKKKKGVLSRCHDWLIPANPKYFDVEAAFAAQDVILWKQGADISVGDTSYMYEAAPYSCLRFRCRAEEVDIPYEKKGTSPVKIRKAMRIRLLETYPTDYMPLSVLREEYGVYSVRGPRSTPPALLSELRARAKALEG